MKTYEETQCAFHKIPSRKVLARYLQSSEKHLQTLCKEDLYKDRFEKKKSGGVRHIEAPRPDLKRVQKRIAKLLQRIAPPDFLCSPVKGRSYVDNAERHRSSKSFHLLDISDFYPHCTAKRVAWFFGKRMGCAPDVTAMLVSLTTRNGRLPQGSPASPILAYFSYIDMWSEIDGLVRHANCKLSVYVDDVTISGIQVPKSLAWQIRKVVHKYGHRAHPGKEKRVIGRPVEITGVVINGSRLKLPNRQHKKLAELKQAYRRGEYGPDRKKMLRQISGREAQAHQVLSRS